MARGLKFRIYEIEGLYYPCSENKGADQLRGYRQADLRLCFRTELICAFVFAYAKSRFSHDEAQLKLFRIPKISYYLDSKSGIANGKGADQQTAGCVG